MWHRWMQLWLCKDSAKAISDRVWSRVNNNEDIIKESLLIIYNCLRIWHCPIVPICFSNLFFQAHCTICISLLICRYHSLSPCTKLPDQYRFDRFSQLCCIGFLTPVISHFHYWLLSPQSIFLHILMYYFKILFCFL